MLSFGNKDNEVQTILTFELSADYLRVPLHILTAVQNSLNFVSFQGKTGEAKKTSKITKCTNIYLFPKKPKNLKIYEMFNKM